jgi:hypothetical protein
MSLNFVYLPPEFSIPSLWEDARGFIIDRQTETADVVNQMQNGYYESVEFVSGKRFLSLNDFDPRIVYRKVIEVGHLPNNGTVSIPHGISNIQIMTHIYGTANSTNEYLPLPYSGADYIELWVDNINVNVSTTSDRTAFVAYVILEYLRG